MHPHVKDEQLCAGDATVPVAQALAQGRITDAFCMISAVLHTYNAHSAYVGLDDWSGPTCGDCGTRPTRGEVYSCAGCGSEFCERCTSCCARCDSSFCMSCLSENEEGELICSDCARTCRTCGGRADANMLRRQDGQCASCVTDDDEVDDDEDDDADDDDSGAESADAETVAQDLPYVTPASAGPFPSPVPNPLPEIFHEQAQHDSPCPTFLVTAIASAVREHPGREARSTAGIGICGGDGETAIVALAPPGITRLV
jgi:hypothetical protein